MILVYHNMLCITGERLHVYDLHINCDSTHTRSIVGIRLCLPTLPQKLLVSPKTENNYGTYMYVKVMMSAAMVYRLHVERMVPVINAALHGHCIPK